MSTNILIVDDHELTRSGLSLLLSQQDDIKIIGMLDNGGEVLCFVRSEPVDIVFLDLDLPDVNGLNLLAELIGTLDQTVVVLTGKDDPKAFSFALKMGVRSIIGKADSSREILKALGHVQDGHIYCSPSIQQKLDMSASADINLSPRQAAILHFLVNGEANKEIAYKLGIAMPTVSFHLSEIRKKLGVTSNKKIISAAAELGIL
ncbi:MAG: response regulator transcription factor [Pseudomonadota bacterium]